MPRPETGRVITQPGVARPGADEAGENGIGRSAQVFVGHGPMQADGSDIA